MKNYIEFIESYLWKKMKNYKRISTWRDYEVIIYNNKVFRFPKNKEKILDIQTEKKKLDKVRKYIDIAVPNYNIIDNTCIEYDLILWKSLDQINIWFTEDMIYDISYFLKQLHIIPMKEFEFLEKKSTSKYKEKENEKDWFKKFVNNLKEKVEKNIKGKISSANIKNIHEYMDELFFMYKSPKKAFVHNDLQPKNIIYDTSNNRISWIVDFTDSTIWWIELDFCHFYEKDEKLLKKIVKIYQWHEDKDFLERIFFLARREVVFEIENTELCKNKFNYIKSQLEKYKFI